MSALTDQRWIVVEDDQGFENIHFAPDDDEAEKGLLGDIVATTFQDAETAHLIAMAPVMASLLKGLLEQFDHDGCRCTFPTSDCCAFARADTLVDALFSDAQP